MKTTQTHTRNNSIFDIWSIIHATVGIGFGWLLAPLPAIVIMVLWEPLEIFILSPLLSRIGVIFGFETFRNSMSDIFFDILGIIVGYFVLRTLVAPPFQIF